MSNINNITDAERAGAKTEASDAVKAALLISGANKRRYGGLKNDLGKNIYWEKNNTQIPQIKREYCWGTINLHAKNNVINPEMMEELA